MSKTSMSKEVPPLKKGKDGYYRPVYAQGGGTKVFWSYVSASRNEAEAFIRKPEPPTVSEKLPSAIKNRMLKKIRSFRKNEVKLFNKNNCVAFYTDVPHRFSGKNRSNPTTEMFDASGFNYEFITSEQIFNGELDKYRLVFCPGGFGYFTNKKMTGRFRSYLRKGGGFIGFCAGAFLPLKDGLGVCESTYLYFREQGFPDVMLNPRDPVAKGIKNTKNPVCYAHFNKPSKQRHYTVRIQMYRCNGPLLIPKGKDKAVGYFDSNNNYAPILRAVYGKGRIISVGPHPDCGLKKMLEATNEDNAVENVKLFKNMVLHCARIGS